MKRIIRFIFVLLLIIPGILFAQKPIAIFSPLTDEICGSTGVVHFTDISINNPTHWKWYFTGGIPDTSTLKNPPGITFNGYGCHSVKLVVSNNSGSDSLTDSNAICLFATPKVKIRGPKGVCQSGVVFDTITALNFHWPDGKTDSVIPILVIVSHTYTIQIKNGPCFIDTSITVSADSMPSNIFEGKDSICVGDSTIIYALNGLTHRAGSGYKYLWSTGSTADSIIVNGKAPGNYIYYLSVTNRACTKDSSELIVNVHYCVGGIESYFNSLGIEIFPNPVTNRLTLFSDNSTEDNIWFTINDVTGRTVKSGIMNLNKSINTLDVSSLAPAVYFLQLQTQRGIAVKKFVKE